MPVCKCGCGGKISKRAKSCIHGHNRMKTSEEAITSMIEIDENGCWIWQGYKQKSGHGQVRFRNKTYSSHRFSYQTFKKEDISNKVICHKCDNASCVNPDHLYAGNQYDNLQDMVWKGTAIFGKITEDEDVLKIRELYSSGDYTQKRLGEMFDLNAGSISRIVNKKRHEYSYEELNDNMFGGD